MSLLLSILIPAFLLLMANAIGFIDLNTHPLTRVLKWLIVAALAWASPLLVHRFFKFQLNPQLVDLWNLLILGFLFLRLISASGKWIWSAYGPAPEGHRRCPRCRKPILKVMLECPQCQKLVDAAW